MRATARDKHVDSNPRFLLVDPSHFDARWQNDETGAPAYPPAMLLRVVLFAYAQGIVSTSGDDIAHVFTRRRGSPPRGPERATPPLPVRRRFRPGPVVRALDSYR